MTAFKLSRDQRLRLLGGDFRPLVCDVKPHGCDPGATYVLSWSRASRTVHDGHVTIVPRQPLRWLVVAKVVRHRKGGWLVAFDVKDQRTPVRYLRASPPVWDPHGSITGGDGTEESFYTSSRWAAIDDLECVPRDWQVRASKQASERDHKLRLAEAAERSKDRWRSKRRRKLDRMAA